MQQISARITGGGGLAPLVQALPQTPIIGLCSALAISPPENFLIIRPLPQMGLRLYKLSVYRPNG